MEDTFETLPFTPEGTYETSVSNERILYRAFPSFFFYLRLIHVVIEGSRVAKKDGYTRQRWIYDSMKIIRGLERSGIKLNITGINNIKETASPVVFVGNHMSMLETTVLPGIIAPIKPITFVIKESLVKYPVFKHIMIATNPITVTRTNPREDFKKVINEGTQMIRQGVSVIVFPQTTRTVSFDPEAFNTIGIKLAKFAQVPVIPIALKTDAWQNGKVIKDLGRLIPKLKVHFCFGKPLYIMGRGIEEHKEVIEFIQSNLMKWGSL